MTLLTLKSNFPRQMISLKSRLRSIHRLYDWQNKNRAVVNYTNRMGGNHMNWGQSARAQINKEQFSAINSNEPGAYKKVQNVPDSKVNPVMKSFITAYLVSRAVQQNLYR